MHLDASYAIWGGAFAALLSLLVGVYVVRGIKHVKQSFFAHHECLSETPHETHVQQDIEHRALMFLMTQKTDSMLAALTKTIEKERQKLGLVVRNPSMVEEIDACEETTPNISDRPQTEYEQILPLAQDGMDIATIAHRLRLSETEVSLVMRLNAA